MQGLSSEESDFPFEFSTAKGSVVTADNVLTQSVSSDGDAVFKENSPQPIKKYGSKKMTGGSGKKTQKVQSANYWPESNQKTSKNPKPQGNKHTTVYEFPEKREGSSSHAVSYAAAAPASGASQWDVMENMLYKYYSIFTFQFFIKKNPQSYKTLHGVFFFIKNCFSSLDYERVNKYRTQVLIMMGIVCETISLFFTCKRLKIGPSTPTLVEVFFKTLFFVLRSMTTNRNRS